MQKRKASIRVFSVLCALMLLVCALPIGAHAETAAERYARLKKELEATRGTIKTLKNDVAKAKELKQALEEQLAIIEEMVQLNQDEIARTEGELAQKQQEIADKRQVIYESDLLLQKRLVAIYNMNNSTILSQLLAADSFSEFFTLLDAMRRISKNDTDLLQHLSEQRAQLEAEQAEIDGMLARLQGYHEELLQNQADLQQNLMAADTQLTEAQAALAAQQQVEGETSAALVQAQKEMQAIANSIGGSSKGDGSEFVGGRLGWPVPGIYEVTCEFGQADPNGKPHGGMDVRAPAGTPIASCADGTVIQAAYAHASYGNFIVVDHGGGIKTLYAHCTAILANAGTAVSKGQTIATVGSTGFSTGNHLHLEVIDNGVRTNPRSWLQA